MAYNGFKGVGPRGLGTSPLKKLRKAHSVKVNEANAPTYGRKPAFKHTLADGSPAKQLNQRDIAPTEKKGDGKGLRKMNNRELYIRDMKKQNDSLRKLPRTDQHHLPTFDTSTEEGSKAQKDFYTPSPKNEKLRKLRKLGDKLRKKHNI
tara:strand:+ start:31 stop:477 length:447 start_codon:yes stop_codon:yes gene_type:complete